MTVTFDDSGNGTADFTLQDIQQLAIQYGYKKNGVAPNKPIAQRVDMEGFLKVYKSKALSKFRNKFAAGKLYPPEEQKKVNAQLKAEKRAREGQKSRIKAKTAAKPEPIEKYDSLAPDFDKESVLKWRIISRPGGAIVKPDDFYRCWAAREQVEKGDIPADWEKPQWTKQGGVDFEGKEKWEAWNSLKGMTPDEGKQQFLQALADAHADNKTNFRVF